MKIKNDFSTRIETLRLSLIDAVGQVTDTSQGKLKTNSKNQIIDEDPEVKRFLQEQISNVLLTEMNNHEDRKVWIEILYITIRQNVIKTAKDFAYYIENQGKALFQWETQDTNKAAQYLQIRGGTKYDYLFDIIRFLVLLDGKWTIARDVGENSLSEKEQEEKIRECEECFYFMAFVVMGMNLTARR